MSSILIRSATPPQLLGVHWAQSAPDIYLGDGATMMPAPPVGAVIIAQAGVVVNLSEYLAIRPLGNADGQATDSLRYHHFMGEEQLIAGNPIAADPIEQLYPSDNLPIAIEVRHKQFTGNANPEWDGWGWRAEIVGGAASRDPSARAIAIYHDAECLDYWYTTAAFTQQQSVWQTNAQDHPLTVWATEYNPAFIGVPNDSKADVHHACLLGAAQEGHATLRATDERAYHEFWLHDQGYVAPPSATWVDTGTTVAQLVGSGVYRMSGIPSGLTINQSVRLGGSAPGETVFKGYWPTAATPSDYITIAPHVSVAVGTKLWKWA